LNVRASARCSVLPSIAARAVRSPAATRRAAELVQGPRDGAGDDQAGHEPHAEHDPSDEHEPEDRAPDGAVHGGHALRDAHRADRGAGAAAGRDGGGQHVLSQRAAVASALVGAPAQRGRDLGAPAVRAAEQPGPRAVGHQAPAGIDDQHTPAHRRGRVGHEPAQLAAPRGRAA